MKTNVVYTGLKPNKAAGEDLSAEPTTMGTVHEASWVSKAIVSILQSKLRRIHEPGGVTLCAVDCSA